MVFSIVFLIGMAFPFIFIKAKGKWLKWLPGMIFFIGTLGMGVKVLLYPAAEMAVLGEIIYFMMLGTAALGSFLSGVIIYFMNKKPL
ncbi:hypothetical protein V7201_16335 [Bacillus sp. JJ1122]